MPGKLTTEEFIKKAKEVHGDKYDYSKVDYKNTKTKVTIICPTHGEFYQRPSDHIEGSNCPKCNGRALTVLENIERARKVHSNKYDYSKVNYKKLSDKVCIICPTHGEFFQAFNTHINGRGCYKCSRNVTLSKKEFICKAREVHGDKYDYCKVGYKSTKEKVCIICPDHGEFYQRPRDHIRGQGCPSCSGRIKTTEKFINKAKEVHGDKYDYCKVDYKNTNNKVCIICPDHGEFYQTPYNHLRGSGCPVCSGKFKLTTDQFIKKAKEVHGDKYDYSKVDYKNNREKICIVCSEHGEFFQTPEKHLNGSGCPRCSNNVRLTTEEFIERARKVHDSKYDYSKVNYKNSKEKVCIICSIHGEFYQVPNSHLRGAGCSECNGLKNLTTDEFIKKAKSIHGDLYNYSKVNYKNNRIPVEIFCKVHGYFSQTPNTHLSGSGCPKCNIGFSSDSKLSLLSNSDVEHLSVHQLIELIGQNLLPADFKVLTKSASGSSERKDDINKLRESIGSGVEENETAEEDQVLQEEQVEFEDAQTIAAEDQSDNLLNVLPDLVTKELKTYDKYFVSSGEKGAYLLKESVNKIWNCVLSSESYLETVKEMRESSGPWLTYVLDTFMMEYKSVQNEKVGPDYKFEYPPSLMQKLMSYRIATNPYYGNWCGTGAGKTNAFLIASRRIDARVTVCVCPNAVVETIRKSILRVYPESTIIIPKSLDDIVSYDRSKYNYVILNYEKFCQSYSPALVDKLVGLNQIDFLCFDEVHRAKNDLSSINQNLTNLRVLGGEKNPGMRVLGMTATPLINNLSEVRNLLELITGTSFEDIIPTNLVTINNIHNAYKYLMLYGFRYVPDYKINCIEEKVDIDGTKELAEKLVGFENSEVGDIEGHMVQIKYEGIRYHIKKYRTIIYTQFIKNILPRIKEELRKDGISFREYTGEIDSVERDSIVSDFAQHKFDVILASSPITTGVDGLQKICDTIIILSLPWTNAEYVQLVGRINRQGSEFGSVKIVVPQVKIKMNNGKEWSWDDKRFRIIKTKRTLSDAVVDGRFASIFSLNRSKLLRDAVESLREGIQDFTITRKKLEVEVVETKIREYSSESIITSTHQKASTSTSTRMHEWFSEDKSRWKDYHKVREENIKDWVENPITVIAERLNENPGQIIADLGCGMNRLKDLVKNYKAWYSFDHCAVDPSVVEADCSDLHEYLGDESVDSAVFCMSLWGTNYLDSIKEAHRYLKTGGTLYVVEPKDKVDQSVLLGEVVQLGFNLTNLVLERNGKTYFEYKKVR